MEKQYAERDPIALDRAGGYFTRHLAAMTAEGLHDKAAIAEELAHRDMEIDRLRKDAERYRWLRHGDNDELVIQRQHKKVAPFLLRNEKLDAAIDAAMRE